MDSEPHVTLESSQLFIKNNLKKYNDKKGIFWATVQKSSDEFIGDFAFYFLFKKRFYLLISFLNKETDVQLPAAIESTLPPARALTSNTSGFIPALLR